MLINGVTLSDLGHHDDLFSGQIEVFDGFPKNNFRFTIGVDLI